MKFAGDEVAGAAPRGRDSIAQGASALSQASIERAKPQRGGIPSLMSMMRSRWESRPVGAGRALWRKPRASLRCALGYRISPLRDFRRPRLIRFSFRHHLVPRGTALISRATHPRASPKSAVISCLVTLVAAEGRAG